jgi:hypothetical protein
VEDDDGWRGARLVFDPARHDLQRAGGDSRGRRCPFGAIPPLSVWSGVATIVVDAGLIPLATKMQYRPVLGWVTGLTLANPLLRAALSTPEALTRP